MVKGGKPIKVCLTNRGTDTETPWALDLGPASEGGTARKVRLINVPFLHAKPTWGDTIIVTQRDGLPTWDRNGVPFAKVHTRILEDGGRWAMIIDYAPHPDAEPDDAFAALVKACADNDVVCEGAWGPRDNDPGRAYLAVDSDLDDRAVMRALRDAELPCELIQIHPEPSSKPAPRKPVKSVRPAPPPPKPAAKKPAKKSKKPAPKSRARR